MRAGLRFRFHPMCTASCRAFTLFVVGAQVHGAIFRKLGVYGTVPHQMDMQWSVPALVQAPCRYQWWRHSFDLCLRAASHTPVDEAMFDSIPNL